MARQKTRKGHVSLLGNAERRRIVHVGIKRRQRRTACEPRTEVTQVQSPPCRRLSMLFFIVSCVCMIVRALRRLQRLGTTGALVPLKPLSLARASLEVRCDGRGVATASNHGATHFVAVGVERSLQEESTTYLQVSVSTDHSFEPYVSYH